MVEGRGPGQGLGGPLGIPVRAARAAGRGLPVVSIAQAIWLSLFRAGVRDREFIGVDNFTRLAGDPVVLGP